MNTVRPYSDIIDQLRASGLRPTRQRMALARLLFQAGDRHVTAEQLLTEAHAASIRVSLATIYNTLHQFTKAGLLREVMVEPGRAYFDSNTSEHHHFFLEEEGVLLDIDGRDLPMAALPTPPDGTEITRVDVIIRCRQAF